MNQRRIISLLAGGLLLTSIELSAKTTLAHKPIESDLASIEARKSIVDMANNLAKMENPAPLPEVLPLPFNPSGFNRSAVAAKATPDAPAVKPVGDHEILAALAQRVLPTGTFNFGGERWLQFSKKRLKVGDHLTVTQDGTDYTLELTAIDATNFTLRLNREEITRPIKPGKNP